MEVEVRPLVVDDVFIIARMLSKVTKGAKKELAEALKAKSLILSKEDWDKLSPKEQEENAEGMIEQPDLTELGMTFFQCMFVETEEDLKTWLANLISKTKEEFIIMPATTVIDIIEKLVNQEDIKDFFGRVSQLVKTIKI